MVLKKNRLAKPVVPEKIGSPETSVPPTLVWWRGLHYTQSELAGIIEKDIDFIASKYTGLAKLVGENPYADLRIPRGLARALDHLGEAMDILDLVMLCQDSGARKEGEETPKERKERQELIVDGWQQYFRDAYDNQSAGCRRKQRFDGDGGYWKWVKKFFLEGGAGEKGWFDTIDELLQGVTDAAKKQRLRDRLIELGKKIIAEISKHNDCRKIRLSKAQVFEGGKPDLKSWGDRLKEAKQRDNGDGTEIERELERIEREVNEALQ
jgi:hypothetical protein